MTYKHEYLGKNFKRNRKFHKKFVYIDKSQKEHSTFLIGLRKFFR